MSKTILVTGGARSGKSRLAEAKTLVLGSPATYIATAQAWDDEMAARIAAHRDDRGTGWHTVEAPIDLLGALHASEGQGPRLVDCLTLWLTNVMLAEDGAEWHPLAVALTAYLAETPDPVVLVSNEVGMGIVPDTALGRAFRDAQGSLNQMVAGVVDEVYLAVSGLPMKVK